MAGVIKQFTDYPVRISVFENNTKDEMDDKTFYSFKPEKIIKKEDGTYTNVSSFNSNELARLALLTQRAYYWMLTQKEKQR